MYYYEAWKCSRILTSFSEDIAGMDFRKRYAGGFSISPGRPKEITGQVLQGQNNKRKAGKIPALRFCIAL
jgi:hypothetical protein